MIRRFTSSSFSLLPLARSSVCIKETATKPYTFLSPLPVPTTDSPDLHNPVSPNDDPNNSWFSQQFNVLLFPLPLCSLSIKQSHWIYHDKEPRTSLPLSALITEKPNLDNSLAPMTLLSLVKIVHLSIPLSNRLSILFLEQAPLSSWLSNRSSLEQIRHGKYSLRP